jgi:hypothetical protein
LLLRLARVGDEEEEAKKFALKSAFVLGAEATRRRNLPAGEAGAEEDIEGEGGDWIIGIVEVFDFDLSVLLLVLGVALLVVLSSVIVGLVVLKVAGEFDNSGKKVMILLVCSVVVVLVVALGLLVNLANILSVQLVVPIAVVVVMMINCDLKYSTPGG